MRICVIGGGIVGTATAYYLARDGHQVTVLEGRHGTGLGASFANAAQLSYSYVAPLASPSVLRKLPGWLLNPNSALRFVPHLEPSQWRWCLSFLTACRASTARDVTARLLDLSYYSRSLMIELLRDEALDFDHERNGKLVVFRSKSEFDAAKRQMDGQAALGSEQQALDRSACVALEPALSMSVAQHIIGGIYTPSDEIGDCFKLATELARISAKKYGAVFRFGVTVTALRRTGQRIAAALVGREEVVSDVFIIAAGMGSRDLLRPLGVFLPIFPLTGYSLTIPIDAGHESPKVSITDAHHKVVYVALGQRLRIAGMVDITCLNPKPDTRRLALLSRQARESFPNGGDFSRAQAWCGHRPATPLSKPLLGPTQYGNLWLNTGHGSLGFTLACGSARLVADWVSRRPSAINKSAFILDSPRDIKEARLGASQAKQSTYREMPCAFSSRD